MHLRSSLVCLGFLATVIACSDKGSGGDDDADTGGSSTTSGGKGGGNSQAGSKADGGDRHPAPGPARLPRHGHAREHRLHGGRFGDRAEHDGDEKGETHWVAQGIKCWGKLVVRCPLSVVRASARKGTLDGQRMTDNLLSLSQQLEPVIRHVRLMPEKDY